MKRSEIEKYIKEKFDILGEQIFQNIQNLVSFVTRKTRSGSPDLAMVLVDERQIFKAYHMNKKHWISVNLNSKISQKTVFDLIDESFSLRK